MSLPRTIRIAESGGVTGIALRRELETSSLGDEDRAKLTELWGAAQEPLFRGVSGQEESHPDEERYAVTAVDEDGGVRTADVRRRSAPADIIDLLDWIRARARPSGR